jgi:hypothetical protein
MIFLICICGQIIIVEHGGAAFQTVPLSRHHWVLSIALGLLSIPIGVIVRLMPDETFTMSRRNIGLSTVEPSKVCQDDDARLAWSTSTLLDTNVVKTKFCNNENENKEEISWSRVV